MGGFKEELKTSLKLSSIKGVPRVVGASGFILKAIWAFSILIFFGICVYHVSTVLATYFGYPKVVTASERKLNFLDEDTVPFPTVVVCNANPFTSNRTAFEANGILFPKEFYQKVLELTSCDNCSVGDNVTMQRLKRLLMTNRGYYQSVGKEAMANVSHKNLVAQCMAIISESSAFVGMPCDEHATNYSFVHPDLGLCYAYNAKISSEHLVLGYNFLLHLDSSFDNANTEYDPDHVSTHSSGAVVYTFDPNTVPNWMGTFALSSPGKTTVNHIHISKIDRLSTPYSESECIPNENAKKVQYEEQYFDYNFMHCYGECTSQYVVEHCNCTDLFMQQSPETEPPKYGYCASVELSKEQMFKNMACSESVKNSGSTHCLSKCKEPCTEVKYTMTTTATNWPLPSQTGTFYQRLIKGSVYEEKYSHKEDIYNSLAAGHNNISEIDRLLALKAIEDNFATVYVYLADNYFYHMKDEVKLELGSLISLIGGSLNLWSGITMLIFVEVLDFFVRLTNSRVMQGTTSQVRSDKVSHK